MFVIVDLCMRELIDDDSKTGYGRGWSTKRDNERGRELKGVEGWLRLTEVDGGMAFCFLFPTKSGPGSFTGKVSSSLDLGTYTLKEFELRSAYLSKAWTGLRVRQKGDSLLCRPFPSKIAELSDHLRTHASSRHRPVNKQLITFAVPGTLDLHCLPWSPILTSTRGSGFDFIQAVSSIPTILIISINLFRC